MTKKLPLVFAAMMLVGFTYSQSIQRPNFLKKDSIQSTLDKNTQVFYYDKSTSSKAKPWLSCASTHIQNLVFCK
jgi:hypothetical protein